MKLNASRTSGNVMMRRVWHFSSVPCYACKSLVLVNVFDFELLEEYA